ncbi:hypothetical protein A6A21_09750 [Phocoenobacter uteri]|nr:DUF4035 domain-containing protein [Phocoenobacter uteri]MDG6880946.1 hypothetical protein [Phocoenobacter uteri]MDG6882791.1 hypothetical protein [Phocoenobacter uteri]
MPEREYQEYELYYQEQPFGLWREDYRTAQISYMLALINRDPKKEAPKISDFLPLFNDSSTAEEQEHDDGSAEFLANR